MAALVTAAAVLATGPTAWGSGTVTGWVHLAALCAGAGTAASAAVLFCAAGSTTAGALGAVAAALVVVAAPGAALPVAGGLALVALACGASPAWTRREVAAGGTTRPSAGGAGARLGGGRRGRHAQPLWNGERVLPAGLVLLFPLLLAVLWVHTGA